MTQVLTTTKGHDTPRPLMAAVTDTRRIPITVTGPDNRSVDTHWLLLPDGTGLVDLATTSGLHLMSRPRPMTAHTRGFGQAIAAALDHGVTRLILTLAGSCSTDCGAGILRELGVALLDRYDRPIRDGGVGLVDLGTIDLSRIGPCPIDGVLVITDETHPLLGKWGTARTLAAQHGVSPTRTTAPPTTSPGPERPAEPRTPYKSGSPTRRFTMRGK